MKKQSVQFPNLIRSLRLLSLPAVILMLLFGSVVVPQQSAALADGTTDFKYSASPCDSALSMLSTSC